MRFATLRLDALSALSARTSSHMASPALGAPGALRSAVERTKNIDGDRGYLSHRGELDRIQLRRLNITRYNAANAPQSIPDLACERLVAKNAHCEWLKSQNRGRTATLPD